MLDAELVDPPAVGRRFSAGRRVRLGDADRHGRLRLDALARLLQDVGNDDTADAGHDPAVPWVARRSLVSASSWPRLGQRLAVTTWCGGLGGRWAERRTSVMADGGGAEGGRVEVAALWVHLDDRGRPSRLPQWFLDTYGPAAQGRTVSARPRLGGPTIGGSARPWPLRSSDLDVLGHVNNAATWQAVEDEAARRGVVPVRAELEYGAAIGPDDDVTLRSQSVEGGFCLWLTVGTDVRAAALVHTAILRTEKHA